MVTFPMEGTKREAFSRTSWGKFYKEKELATVILSNRG
jgi:hypothetical protein